MSARTSTIQEAEVPRYNPYFRCVEDQAHQPLRQLSATQEEFDFLEDFVEAGKPPYPSAPSYHYLIQTPFRYPLPVPDRFAARFRPPFSSRHVFYASANGETSLYEASTYFLKERIHIPDLSHEPESRTLFSVGVDDEDAYDLSGDAGINPIMSRNSYGASHAFIAAHPEIDVLLYPSCRCPNKGRNAAVFDINSLEQNPRTMIDLSFSYDAAAKAVRIYEGRALRLTVGWGQVG